MTASTRTTIAQNEGVLNVGSVRVSESMTVTPIPTGYDKSKAVNTNHPDCLIVVGFDQNRGRIPRFLVRLHYDAKSTDPRQWEGIARFDHNETPGSGHNVYTQGLHIDVSRRSGGEVKIHPRHSNLPANRGSVIRLCVQYFDIHAQHFIDIYEGNISPGGPPRWPDGGDSPHTLFTENHISHDMEPDLPREDVVSKEELSDLLADATNTTAEEIERGAEEIEIASPEDAEVVNSD